MTTGHPLYLTIELGRRELENRVFVALSAVARGREARLIYHKEPALFAASPGLILHKDHGAGSRWDIPQLALNGHVVHALDEEGLIVTDETVYRSHRMHPAVLSVLSGVFTWGTHHLDRFRPGETGSVSASGHPKIDTMRMAGALRREMGEDILVNTRFPYAIMSDARFARELGNLRVLGFLKTDADEARFRRTVAGDRRILGEFMRLLELCEADGLRVRLRPHPAEDREHYARAIAGMRHVVLDTLDSLGESFAGARLVVHDGCTTAIEARAFGLPVLGLRPGGIEDAYPDFANRFSRNFESAEALFDALRQGVPGPARIAGQETAFIANLDGPLATDRILDVMLEGPQPPGNGARRFPVPPALGWGHVKMRIGTSLGALPVSGAGFLAKTPLGNWARFSEVRTRKFGALPDEDGLSAMVARVAAIAPDRFGNLAWRVRRDGDHAFAILPA